MNQELVLCLEALSSEWLLEICVCIACAFFALCFAFDWYRTGPNFGGYSKLGRGCVRTRVHCNICGKEGKLSKNPSSQGKFWKTPPSHPLAMVLQGRSFSNDCAVPQSEGTRKRASWAPQGTQEEASQAQRVQSTPNAPNALPSAPKSTQELSSIASGPFLRFQILEEVHFLT